MTASSDMPPSSPSSRTPPGMPPSFDPATRTRAPKEHRAPRLHIGMPNTRPSVLIVTLASGLLFGMAAANARDTTESSGELGDLVRHRNAVVENLDETTRTMKHSIDTLIKAHSTQSSQDFTHPLLASLPLTGPGLTVTLTDAPPGPIPEKASPDDLVIHQQDIESVMNALWAGGAEAMAVQGKRVNSRSVIRCIGNVIYIDGVSYSPPYKISAIGDPDTMSRSLTTDHAVQIYQAYVAAYGLGWKLEINDNLELPAASNEPAVQHAQVMEQHG